jgi:hypothetical protein
MPGGQTARVTDAVRLTPMPDVIDLPSSRPKPTTVAFVPAGGRNAVLIGSGAIPVTGDDSFRIARSPAVNSTYSGSTAMLSTRDEPDVLEEELRPRRIGNAQLHASRVSRGLAGTGRNGPR